MGRRINNKSLQWYFISDIVTTLRAPESRMCKYIFMVASSCQLLLARVLHSFCSALFSLFLTNNFRHLTFKYFICSQWMQSVDVQIMLLVWFLFSNHEFLRCTAQSGTSISSTIYHFLQQLLVQSSAKQNMFGWNNSCPISALQASDCKYL